MAQWSNVLKMCFILCTTNISHKDHAGDAIHIHADFRGWKDKHLVCSIPPSLTFVGGNTPRNTLRGQKQVGRRRLLANVNVDESNAGFM